MSPQPIDHKPVEPKGFDTGILESIEGITWEAEADTFRFLKVGITAEKVLGYPVAQWLDEPNFWQSHIHPEDRDRAVQACLTCSRLGVRHQFDYRMIHRNGGSVWLRDFVTIPEPVDGRPVLRGLMLNVSREMEARIALQSSEERLDLALKGADLGVWDWNIQSGKVVFSDRLQTMLGYQPGEMEECLHAWSKLIHPQDQARVFQTLEAHLQGNTPYYETEHRLRGRRGEWMWVLDRGRVVDRDSAGRPIRAAGTHMNVTERKRTEEALAASEDLLRSLFNSASDGIILMSAEQEDEGRILMVNEASALAHGYSMEELLTMNIRDLDTPESASRIHERMDLLRDNRAICFEVEHARKDGSRFPLEVSASTASLRGQRCVVAFNRDTTQRKQDQARLKLLETCIEHTNDLVLISSTSSSEDAGARIVYANRAFEKLTGYAREDAVGKMGEMLLGPRTNPEVVKQMRQSLKNGVPIRSELIAYTKDGREIFVELDSDAVADGPTGRTHWVSVGRDVTERRQSQERLQMAEERFRALVEAAAQIVWTANVQGQVLDDSPSWRNYTGQTLEEMQGHGWLEAIHPGDRTTTRDWIDQLRHRNEPFEMEYRLRHHEGGWRWNLVRGVPMKNQDGSVRFWVGMNTDVEEKRRSEEMLKLSRFTMEKAAQSILWIRKDAGILEANEAMELLLGWGREELRTMRVSDFAPEFPSSIWADHWARLKREGSLKFNTRLKGRSRQEREVEVHANFLVFGEEELNCAFIHDISGRLASEREKATLQEQLQQSQKMEAVGTLAGGIAHDFNNLLGVMLGNAELAKLDVLPGTPSEESLNEIVNAAKKAKALVQQVLTFSRRKPAVQNPLALEPVILEAVKFMKSSIPPSVEVDFQTSGNCPLVMADEAQIHQVLVNLCTNAWHALDARNGSIKFRLGSAYLDLDQISRMPGLKAGRHAVISVEDTGKGMEPEILSRIFEPFFTTKEVGKGTGLGLSVVHGIIQNHHGHILAHSVPGQGSIFKIYLPAVAGPEFRAVENAGRQSRGHGEHLLLVDDETALLRIATKHLERNGYRVSAFSKPVEALEAFRTAPNDFDLIITDSEMPELQGMSLLKRILAIRADIPTFLCSGYLTPSAREEAEQIGVDRILDKPIDVTQLLLSISESLASGQPRAQE